MEHAAKKRAVPDIHGDGEPGMDVSIVAEDASSELETSIPKIIHGMTKHQFRDLVMNPSSSFSTNSGNWTAFANNVNFSGSTAGPAVGCFPLNLADSDIAQGCVNLYTYIQLDKVIWRIHNFQNQYTGTLSTALATYAGVLTSMIVAYGTANPLGAPNTTWVNRASSSPVPTNTPVGVWNSTPFNLADHIGAVKFPVTQPRDVVYVMKASSLNHYTTESFGGTSGGGFPTVGNYSVLPGGSGTRQYLDPTLSFNNQPGLAAPNGFFYIGVPAQNTSVVITLGVTAEYFFTAYLPY